MRWWLMLADACLVHSHLPVHSDAFLRHSITFWQFAQNFNGLILMILGLLECSWLLGCITDASHCALSSGIKIFQNTQINRRDGIFTKANLYGCSLCLPGSAGIVLHMQQKTGFHTKRKVALVALIFVEVSSSNPWIKRQGHSHAKCYPIRWTVWEWKCVFKEMIHHIGSFTKPNKPQTRHFWWLSNCSPPWSCEALSKSTFLTSFPK